jgi:predicted ATPase with chaperone activity
MFTLHLLTLKGVIMEMMIKGLIKRKKIYKSVNIFSYSTNGLPGLEIKIGNKHSKILKEKLVYITRKSNIQIPIKRYVICVESDDLRKEDIQYLELPILILYLTLANYLKISKLEDCLCGGRISLEGVIRPVVISGEYLTHFKNSKKKWKIISNNSQKEYSGLLNLPVEEIIILPLVQQSIKLIGS